MRVSVLIGTRDRFKALTRCLESVLGQTYDSLEILVLDDNSSQYDIEQLVKRNFEDTRLRCWRSDVTLGVAKGRNFLMQRARGDIFCVIDDDACFADSGCVARLANAFEEYPQVGIVAAKVLEHQNDGVDLLVPFSQRWRKRQPDLTTTSRFVSYYLGTCHAIDRTVNECCGGYRDDLIYGEEELDLSYRAIEQGFKILYLPSVVVHHHPEAPVVAHDGSYSHPELYYHIRNRFFLSYQYLPWVYIPTYLSSWLTVYGLQALKDRALREFISGVGAGISLLKQLRRTPLSESSVKYLKTHYGRLWY